MGLGDGLAGRAAALAVANAIYVIVGVLRMKFVAVALGVTAVGSFGQATLLQSLAITVAAAGAVTAGRVGLSAGRDSEEQRRDASARMFRRPFIAALVTALLLVLASPLLSQIYTGSSEHVLLFVAASVGLVPLVLSQSALALIQVLGTARELIRGSVAYLFSGSLAVALLVLPGQENVAVWSFVACPLLQCLSLYATSATLRRAVSDALRRRPPRRTLLHGMARASLAISLLTIGLDTALRSWLANTAGITQVALLQPAQLLAVQAFSLVSVAISQVVMVDQNQRSHGDEEAFLRGPWGTALSLAALMACVALIATLLSPWLVALFFSPTLAAAVPLLIVALAAEPLRALAWTAGSTLLPQHRTWEWAMIQIAALASLALVTLLLAPRVGVISLMWGTLAMTAVVCIATAVVLRPRLERRLVLTAALLTLFTALVATSAVLDDRRVLCGAAAALFPALTMTMRYRRVPAAS